MRSIDNTNYRYGRSAISLASAGVQMEMEYEKRLIAQSFLAHLFIVVGLLF